MSLPLPDDPKLAAMIFESDLATARQERDDLKAKLDETDLALGALLAIIHSDGGHYQVEQGTKKAAEDAEEKYYDLLKKLAEAEVERDKIAKAAYGDAAIVNDMRADLEQCRQERDAARAVSDVNVEMYRGTREDLDAIRAGFRELHVGLIEARATIETLTRKLDSRKIMHDNQCESLKKNIVTIAQQAETIDRLEALVLDGRA